MEGVDGTHKASKLAAEDVISSMPDDVITNIMNHLPIQDAVSTSILARNWRLKWTLLTQLVFDTKFCLKYLMLGPNFENIYDSRIISRLLPHIKGPVTKFSLYIFGQILHVEDFNHWVLLLLRKGIKEFNLVIDHETQTPVTLPTHLFSFLELKHLKLNNCFVDLPTTFHGFPNLLSLDLYHVKFETGNCGELISRCPLLEILNISFSDPICKVNVDDIEKLGNLKKLSLPLLTLENCVMTTFGIFQLLGFLPKLEELHVDLSRCKFFVESGANTKLSTAFPCLKTLKLHFIGFGDGNMLSFAVDMILGSPNLQTLYIIATEKKKVPPHALGVLKLACSRMRSLQLQCVEFYQLRGLEVEVYLIKYLLAHSPFLENISIRSRRSLGSDEKLMFARKLLKLERASPLAKVKFY